MRVVESWKFVAPLFVFAVLCLASPSTAHGQALSLTDAVTIPPPGVPAAAICQETFVPASLKNALRQVCLRKPPAIANSYTQKTIIIGFVGGFVRHDDPKHPEVQFAAYLRDRYASGTYVEVFSITLSEMLFAKSSVCSTPITMAPSRPRRNNKPESSFTDTVGVLQKPWPLPGI